MPQAESATVSTQPAGQIATPVQAQTATQPESSVESVAELEVEQIVPAEEAAGSRAAIEPRMAVTETEAQAAEQADPDFYHLLGLEQFDRQPDGAGEVAGDGSEAALQILAEPAVAVAEVAETESDMEMPAEMAASGTLEIDAGQLPAPAAPPIEPLVPPSPEYDFRTVSSLADVLATMPQPAEETSGTALPGAQPGTPGGKRPHPFRLATGELAELTGDDRRLLNWLDLTEMQTPELIRSGNNTAGGAATEQQAPVDFVFTEVTVPTSQPDQMAAHAPEPGEFSEFAELLGPLPAAQDSALLKGSAPEVPAAGRAEETEDSDVPVAVLAGVATGAPDIQQPQALPPAEPVAAGASTGEITLTRTFDLNRQEIAELTAEDEQVLLWVEAGAQPLVAHTEIAEPDMAIEPATGAMDSNYEPMAAIESETNIEPADRPVSSAERDFFPAWFVTDEQLPDRLPDESIAAANGQVQEQQTGRSASTPVPESAEFFLTSEEEVPGFHEVKPGQLLQSATLDLPAWIDSDDDQAVQVEPVDESELARFQAEMDTADTLQADQAQAGPSIEPVGVAAEPADMPLWFTPQLMADEPVESTDVLESDRPETLDLEPEMPAAVPVAAAQVEAPVAGSAMEIPAYSQGDEEESGESGRERRAIMIAQSLDILPPAAYAPPPRRPEIGDIFINVMNDQARAARVPVAPRRPALLARFNLWPFVLLAVMLLAALIGNNPGRTSANPPAGQLRSPLGAQQTVQRAYDAVDLVPAGGHVLLAYDWDGYSSQAEMQMLSNEVTRHLMSHDVRILTISTLPAGSVLAQTTLNSLAGSYDYRYGTYNEHPNRTYLNLGYLAGNEAGLAGLSQNLVNAKPVDSYFHRSLDTFGASANVSSVDDLDLIVVLAGDESRARLWIEQVLVKHPKLHMIAAVPQSVQPAIFPREGTGQGQLNGVVSGLSGAAEYAALFDTLNNNDANSEQQASLALNRLSAMQGYGLLLLIPVIVAGNIAYLSDRRREAKAAKSNGGRP